MRIRTSQMGVALGVALVWPTFFGTDAGHGAQQGDSDHRPTLPRRAASPVVSFRESVGPLLAENCAGCHTSGGIGSHMLELATALDAQDNARRLARAVSRGVMPPWKPAGDTPPLKHDRTLSPEERVIVQRWYEEGAGLDVEHVTPIVPPPPSGAALSRDFHYELPDSYEGTGALDDDYRCFLVDPGFTEDTYITGHEIDPDESRVVHHALVFLIGPDEGGAEEAAGLDSRDHAPGWSCFGGPGVSGAQGLIASWVPGQGATLHPGGTGYLVKAGSVLVFQVHYNYRGGVHADQSGLVLQTHSAGSDVRALSSVTMFAPVEIPCPDSLRSEPHCDRQAVINQRRIDHGFRGGLIPAFMLNRCSKEPEDFEDLDPSDVLSECDIDITEAGSLVEVGGHMHTKGKSLRVVLNPDRDDEQTLLHIPEWDFNWQGRYQYVTPISIEVGDVVRIECRWDNARPGSAPRYHVWGEGTEDEMCLGALTVLPAEPGL